MDKQNYWQTILVIVVGFLVLHFVFSSNGLLYLALGVGVFSLVSRFFAENLVKIWGKVGEVLGRINGTILLSLIFFLFLTPIAFLMKLLSKADAMQLKKPESSNYSTRNHEYTAKDMENIW
ncbi:SxtJ family membrane protein [Marinilongibacter aquaticus]|uniref:SxtJ family membrane protein n=1 Tax=Marinilongibacter aquaticus TaxID=2975157 RepID=UPI0021BDDF11|nr:SxtJ family membrane protein [Marinilongibacter aquaticus]UBM57718.1 SxtJ family membrane protein [Marinilongibacter aquaticus]